MRVAAGLGMGCAGLKGLGWADMRDIPLGPFLRRCFLPSPAQPSPAQPSPARLGPPLSSGAERGDNQGSSCAPRSSARHLATCAGEEGGGWALVGEMRGGGGNGRVSLPRRSCLQDEGNLSQETSTTITHYTDQATARRLGTLHPTQCYMQPPSAAPGLAGWGTQ